MRLRGILRQAKPTTSSICTRCKVRYSSKTLPPALALSPPKRSHIRYGREVEREHPARQAGDCPDQLVVGGMVKYLEKQTHGIHHIKTGDGQSRRYHRSYATGEGGSSIVVGQGNLKKCLQRIVCVGRLFCLRSTILASGDTRRDKMLKQSSVPRVSLLYTCRALLVSSPVKTFNNHVNEGLRVTFASFAPLPPAAIYRPPSAV